MEGNAAAKMCTLQPSAARLFFQARRLKSNLASPETAMLPRSISSPLIKSTFQLCSITTNGRPPTNNNEVLRCRSRPLFLHRLDSSELLPSSAGGKLSSTEDSRNVLRWHRHVLQPHPQRRPMRRQVHSGRRHVEHAPAVRLRFRLRRRQVHLPLRDEVGERTDAERAQQQERSLLRTRAVPARSSCSPASSATLTTSRARATPIACRVDSILAPSAASLGGPDTTSDATAATKEGREASFSSLQSPHHRLTLQMWTKPRSQGASP